jgi:DNA-binding CsgD family transcriptional regulator
VEKATQPPAKQAAQSQDSSYRDNYDAVGLLHQSLRQLSRNITAQRYDFADIDDCLCCEMFVGNIDLFGVSTRPSLHFASSHAARTMGYADGRVLRSIGGLTIMRRHYKKLEAVWAVRRLLALPRRQELTSTDYIARNKVLDRNGKLAFQPRRYLACNLKQYRTPGDIICIGVNPHNLDREAYTFTTAISADAAVRAKTAAVFKLASGKRRLRVFELRAQRVAPARIASQLGISVDTVNEHLTQIYRILGIEGDKRSELVKFAKRAGLVGDATGWRLHAGLFADGEQGSHQSA